jgi:hypothetical protein
MTAVQDVNLPEVVADVRAVFERYERALVGNDVAVLDELFWDSAQVVRYGGGGENLYGIAAIRGFRAARSPAGLMRSLSDTVITTVGRDFAVASTTFRRTHDGALGRQSQTWVRFAPGWRIIAAHISMLPATPPAAPPPAA